MHLPTRDFGKPRGRVHLDLKTEMLGVEVDRDLCVVYDVAHARGHDFVPLSSLFASHRTYPYRSETSTSRSRESVAPGVTHARQRSASPCSIGIRPRGALPSVIAR